MTHGLGEGGVRAWDYGICLTSRCSGTSHDKVLASRPQLPPAELGRYAAQDRWLDMLYMV